MEYHRKSGNKHLTHSGEASASNMGLVVGLEVSLPNGFTQLVSGPPPCCGPGSFTKEVQCDHL